MLIKIVDESAGTPLSDLGRKLGSNELDAGEKLVSRQIDGVDQSALAASKVRRRQPVWLRVGGLCGYTYRSPTPPRFGITK